MRMAPSQPFIEAMRAASQPVAGQRDFVALVRRRDAARRLEHLLADAEGAEAAPHHDVFDYRRRPRSVAEMAKDENVKRADDLAIMLSDQQMVAAVAREQSKWFAHRARRRLVRKPPEIEFVIEHGQGRQIGLARSPDEQGRPARARPICRVT